MRRLVAASLCATAASLALAQQSDELNRLVDRVARGDEREAKDAADRLLARTIEPLAEALGALESRPPQEQVRLRAFLGRVSARLRLRLLRLELEPADGELLDAFAARYPELVEQLFEDDWRRRRGAVRRLPLEPNTGAGVLVAAKVNDADEDVATAALEVAAALKDEAVARGLIRYVRDATAALKSDFYGANDQDVAATIALFISRASKVLCDARAREAVPAISEALAHFARSDYAVVFDPGTIAAGLGELGDERAADVLVSLLPDRRVRSAKALGAGRLVTQTIGDAALLSLIKIYGLSPETFGVFKGPPPADVRGFLSDEDRQRAHRRYLEWHAQNAGRPADQRTSPTTQPAGKD